MEEHISIVTSLLGSANVAYCIIGELALQYYNVPRVVNDLELCVSRSQLSIAIACIARSHQFEPADLTTFNEYTEYKRGYPRFHSTSKNLPSFTIVVFDDISQSMHPLDQSVIGRDDIAEWADFSPQVSDALPVSTIRSLTWPRLPRLFISFCQRYCAVKDDIAAISAEQLVDGMDIDTQWCETHLVRASKEIQAFARMLVAGKNERKDVFCENEITAFIASEADARRMHKLPGYQ